MDNINGYDEERTNHGELEGSWMKGRWKKEQLLCPDHTSINTQN
jgi:hypothetical protein